MGISQAEQITGEVSAILKTLECAICLELLQTPVSTGCGHFFCRFCITKTLESNYRRPCPLCKKSFTRRGIQEATQRNTIIQAARKLAEVSAQVTGVNLLPKGNTQKESVKDVLNVVPTSQSLKKQDKTRSFSSRKRKSDETEVTTEIEESKMPVLSQKERMGSQVGEDDVSLSIGVDVIPASNKRYCQAFDDDDDAFELPSLEDLFKPVNKEMPILNSDVSKNIAAKNMPNLSAENIVLMETDLASNLPKSCVSQEQSESVCKTKQIKSHCKESSENNVENNLIIKRKRQNKFSKSKDKIERENRQNALKNKTNLVDKEEFEIYNINETENLKKDDENLAKEHLFEFESPTRKSKARKTSTNTKRNSKSFKSDSSVSNSLAEEENLIIKLKEAESYPLRVEIKIKDCLRSNNKYTDGECFNLSETKIPDVENVEPTALTDENLKSDEIMDTAVSVHTVISPQTSKNALSSKSPGWSRVKKVGKDFRVKKFSKLSVEKNCSNQTDGEVFDVVDVEAKFHKISEGVRMDNNDDLDLKLQSKKGTVYKSTKEAISKPRKSKNDSCNEKFQDNTLNSENLLCVNIPDISMEIDVMDVQITSKTNDDNHCVNIDKSTLNLILEKDGRDISKINSAISVQHASNECSAVNSMEQVENNVICANDENPIVAEIPMRCVITRDIIAEADDISSIISKNVKNNISYPAEKQAGSEEKNLDGDVQACYNQFQAPNHYQTDLSTVNVTDFGTETAASKQNGSILDDNMDTRPFEEDDELIPKHPISGLIKESRISKISKIAKCDLSSESALKNDDVYYIEHSQQTSQRLDIYDSKNHNLQLPSAFPVQLTHYHAATFAPNALLKYNEPLMVPYNTSKKHLNTEKTKVVKRTCLTLEEIQDFFTKSSLSGQSETICSLPFLSGSYKLHLCVSEETLNVSVLKVESDVPCVVPPSINYVNLEEKSIHNGKVYNLSEKCIQTSNPNSLIHSPTILPSSNVASDASQPDDCPETVTKPKYNPFPYLSKFFSDSESTQQINGDTGTCNITVENTETSTLSPIRETFFKSPIQINETPDNCTRSIMEKSNTESLKNLQGNDNYFLPNAQNSEKSKKHSIKENYQVICEDNRATKDQQEISEDIEMIDLSSEDSVVEDEDSSILNTFSTCRKNKISNSSSSDKIICGSNVDVPDSDKKESQDEDYLQKNLSIYTNGPVTSACYDKVIEEYQALSSDPDMLFAKELVAPLKSLADEMNSNQGETKSPIQSENFKEKHILSNPEEILSLIKENSISNKNSKQKPSRLSLKSKKSSKFKRIKNYDSDSDSSESSQNDMSVMKGSLKSKNDSNSVSKKNITDTAFQDQSTLNSMLSDDVNSSEIVKEIEDLDEKIKSVEEKLKQCGHADLVSKRKLAKLNATDKKSFHHFDNESEDSDDIFSQSVPPTPPDAIAHDESTFKASKYIR